MIKCPKCEAEFDDGTEFCTKCGEKLTSIVPAEEKTIAEPVVENNQENVVVQEIIEEVEEKKSGNGSKAIYWILAILVLILSLYASFKIGAAGAEIGSIRSVGGKTLEEAYYQELGNVYKGFSVMTSVIGIFFSAVLVKLGKK